MITMTSQLPPVVPIQMNQPAFSAAQPSSQPTTMTRDKLTFSGNTSDAAAKAELARMGEEREALRQELIQTPWDNRQEYQQISSRMDALDRQQGELMKERFESLLSEAAEFPERFEVLKAEKGWEDVGIRVKKKSDDDNPAFVMSLTCMQSKPFYRTDKETFRFFASLGLKDPASDQRIDILEGFGTGHSYGSQWLTLARRGRKNPAPEQFRSFKMTITDHVKNALLGATQKILPHYDGCACGHTGESRFPRLSRLSYRLNNAKTNNLTEKVAPEEANRTDKTKQVFLTMLAQSGQQNLLSELLAKK